MHLLLKNESPEHEKVLKIIYNELYPKKTKKEIIKDLKNYVEKVKMSKKKIEMNT
ncbi:MAG: DUF1366 domain-containing protein, partial [Methanobrevibacter sp.]|nr:DUF1366 domain-containing protein [Candidatus Methanovirga meridionalis]